MSGARRRFRFIKEIAEGGFGKVYLAEQLSQDGFSRIVALKLLHQKWSTHDEIVMRTRDEARLLGLIRHQHIVRVEDLTSVDGKLAIVMEYLEGVDLKAMIGYLREQQMDFPRQALFEILIAVASALDAAYNGEPLQGGDPLRVIHRDIKPSNIFVTVNGGLKVLDFGTARANFAEREAKTQALAFGSQGYMAPERMLGEEDTPAADVFSLGVTLYELLSLEPFGRIPPRPNKFLAKVEEKVASTPLSGDSEWCDQVRETMRLMMAYEPYERPSARQLVDIFEMLATGQNDMGVRRFCRTLVAEAKAALPDLDSGDPLAGNTIEEDTSAVWGMDTGSAATAQAYPVPAVTQSPAPAPQPAGTPAPAPMSQGASGTPAPAPSASPQAVSIPDDSFGDDFADDPPKKKGGALKFVIIAFLLIVIVGGLGVIGVGAIAAALVVVNSQPTTAPVVDTPPVPEEPAAPSVVLPDGGKVISPDKRQGVGRSKSTTLALSGDEAALVTISGGMGFKAEWDGKGTFDLKDLPEGRYKAHVTPVSSGEKIRNQKFEIQANKTCELTFDVAKPGWTGECE